MDLFFETLFDLILEGSFEASKSKKVPKPIRYILIFLISLIYIVIIGFLFYFGIVGLSKNLLAGIILILFGLLFLILSIIKFKKTYTYIKKKNKLIVIF